jgi:hypothetical protein
MHSTRVYPKVSGLSHNEIKTTINTSWEATQRIMAGKLTRLAHKIAIQLHLVAESCTICGSCFRWPVRKLLDTPSYGIGCSGSVPVRLECSLFHTVTVRRFNRSEYEIPFYIKACFHFSDRLNCVVYCNNPLKMALFIGCISWRLLKYHCDHEVWRTCVE